MEKMRDLKGIVIDSDKKKKIDFLCVFDHSFGESYVWLMKTFDIVLLLKTGSFKNQDRLRIVNRD